MPNLVQLNSQTALEWAASGGDELLTLTSLGATSGRNGALHDFGTSARSREFAWRFWCKFATAPVVGERVEIYWRTSDGTSPDNDDGTGDVALSSADKLRNLHVLGAMAVDEASTSPVFVASGYLEHNHRYGGPVVYNATADALSSTAAEHGFSLLPVPFEVQ